MMMSNWVSWNDIFDEKMKDPVYREEFERGYAEFKRQNAAELAKERAIKEKRTRTVRPAFSMSRAKQRLRRPATSRPVKAIEA